MRERQRERETEGEREGEREETYFDEPFAVCYPFFVM